MSVEAWPATLAGCFPDEISGERVVLRRWRLADAAALEAAVRESAEHLRPWMHFMKQPGGIDARRTLLGGWEAAHDRGEQANFAIVVEDSVAGSCGLMTRQGPGTLEIGYWLHVGFLGRGLATETSRLLTDAAFALPGVAAVEIHHDRANVASEAVPRRLGFRLAGERAGADDAPANAGVDLVWRVLRDEWPARSVAP